jgi:hypothetical protein
VKNAHKKELKTRYRKLSTYRNSCSKEGNLAAIDSYSGNSLSVYYYVLKALERVKPLCQ